MANPPAQFAGSLQLVRGLYPEIGTTGALVGQDNILSSGIPANDANNPQFIGQVTLREVHDDEMEIEEHPIEQGAPITDHTFKKAAEIVLEIGWSGQQLVNQGRIPVQGVPSLQYIAQLKSIYEALIQGQVSRTLYTVMTGKRMYVQMAIKHIHTETDFRTENVLAVTLIMRQLLIARTQVIASGAPQNAQANPQATFGPVQDGRAQLQSARNFDSNAALSWGAGP